MKHHRVAGVRIVGAALLAAVLSVLTILAFLFYTSWAALYDPAVPAETISLVEAVGFDRLPWVSLLPLGGVLLAAYGCFAAGIDRLHWSSLAVALFCSGSLMLGLCQQVTQGKLFVIACREDWGVWFLLAMGAVFVYALAELLHRLMDRCDRRRKRKKHRSIIISWSAAYCLRHGCRITWRFFPARS